MNEKTTATTILQNRIDLCKHAQTLKEGEYASIPSPELKAHLLALKEWWGSFPMDIMAKLCLHKSLAKLEALLTMEAKKKDCSQGLDLDNHAQEWVSCVCPWNDVEGKDDAPEGFDPLSPTFSGIVRLVMQANSAGPQSLHDEAAAWLCSDDEMKDAEAPSGVAKKLLAEPQSLQDRVVPVEF